MPWSEADLAANDSMEAVLPAGDGLCSDNSCPCGHPGAPIPRGTGYIFISPEAAEFRKLARTAQKLRQDGPQIAEKLARKHPEKPSGIWLRKESFDLILLCVRGAKARNLDLEVAASDARMAWSEGRAPCRPTPLATPKVATTVSFRDSVLSARNPGQLVVALSRSSRSEIEAGLDAIEARKYPDLVEAGRVLQSVIILGRVFLAYEIYRSKGGEWSQLPASLDHKLCWQILHKRLFPLVKANAGNASVMKDAYDLAMDLITLDREQEAVEYLLATRPGYVEDHEFWIFCCMNNLVARGSEFADRDAAIAQGKAIQAGKIKVPAKCREDVDKFMQQLVSTKQASTSTPSQTVHTDEATDVVRFTCTSCHAKLRSKPKHSGKQVKCPKCGQAVKVPEQPAVSVAAAETSGPSRAEGVKPELLKLPILPHDFDNWRVTHKERGKPVPAFDAEQITSRQNGLSGKQASKLMESGEWQSRTFSSVWSRALQDHVPIETVECLCRYEFSGPRRTITRLFRYGEDKFATITEVS